MSRASSTHLDFIQIMEGTPPLKSATRQTDEEEGGSDDDEEWSNEEEEDDEDNNDTGSDEKPTVSGKKHPCQDNVTGPSNNNNKKDKIKQILRRYSFGHYVREDEKSSSSNWRMHVGSMGHSARFNLHVTFRPTFYYGSLGGRIVKVSGVNKLCRCGKEGSDQSSGLGRARCDIRIGIILNDL
ncbi:hypothetical protein ZWY2020_014531 [Hordeum vulgare]|nr:hypothetical protein ZWY2020_014531 [Hordeum vulgare]